MTNRFELELGHILEAIDFSNIQNSANQLKISQAIQLLKNLPIVSVNAEQLCLVLEQLIASSLTNIALVSEFTNACLIYYQNAIAANPQSAQLYCELGNVYIELKQIDRAIATYQQSIQLQPSYAEAHFKLGNAFLNQGDRIEAEKCYLTAISLNPQFVKPYINLAFLQAKQQRFIEAVENLRQAVNLQPNFAEAWANLGGALIQLKEVAEAEACCRQAIAIKPNHATAYLNLGTSLVEQGKQEEAIGYFERVIALNPNYADAFCNLASIYIQQNHWEAATTYLDKAIAIKPNYPEAYYNLSTVFYQQNKIDDMMLACQKALEIQSNYLPAFYNLALAFSAQGKFEAAIAQCQAALKIQPNCAETYFHLGAIASQHNQLNSAIEYLQRAIELKPTYADAYWNLSIILNKASSIDSHLYQVWRQTSEQYVRFCGEKAYLRSSITMIWAYLNSGSTNEEIRQRFRQLNQYILDNSSTIKLADIELLYEIFQFITPHILDRTELRSQVSKAIASLYTNQIIKPKLQSLDIKISPQDSLSSDCRKTTKNLKIGFISPNFTRHSVGWCCGDIIPALSQLTPHIHLYISRQMQPDDRTVMFARSAEKVYYPENYDRNGNAISQNLIAAIQKDDLDVLIDLDSLTVPLHAEILYAKPAPVCISWLGFDAPYISEQNYYLGDRHTIPEIRRADYLEKILTMPDSFLAIASLTSELSDREAIRHSLGILVEQIAYLSIIPGRKFNQETARAQISILRQVPNSILIHKGGGDIRAIQSIYQQECDRLGIDLSRLKFLSVQRPEEKHRNTYLAADVLLDSYPFNAGTLSMEALWFNLPVVTHVGQQFFSRMSYSFLNTLGIDRGIAWNWEEYIETGVQFGLDMELRTYVRQKLQQSKQPENLSPLWNPQKFAQDLYSILKTL